MKIHITGGDGYIGRNILETLNDKYQISTSDINDLDILNKNLLVQYFKESKPEIIIHLAGLMGAQKSKLDLYNTFQVNSFGLLNVLEAARLNNIKNIIFFSSLTVHGAQDENQRISENDIYFPNHPYAVSKVIGEYILSDYSKFYKINSVTLRPTIVVGNLKGEPNAVNEFTKSAFNDQPIVIYGDGKHEREYISINDLVIAVEKTINYLGKNSNNEICETFIISSGEPISMVGLASKCVEKIGRGKVEHIDKSSQAFSLKSNIDNAKKKLGWEPKNNIDDMIQNILNNIKREKNDY